MIIIFLVVFAGASLVISKVNHILIIRAVAFFLNLFIMKLCSSLHDPRQQDLR